jgi:hypothetical protein
MAYTILFGTFAFLMLLGMPIAFCLGIASLATVLYIGIPPIVIFQQLNSGMNVFAMMAIPFFIFAGDLMVRGGIAFRLIRFASGFVGHMRGGLGQVNIVSSTLFGGISGSAVADASAIGGLMVPQMAARGYDRGYAVNVTISSALIALMIPPSHNMILYSISAGGTVSVADLFTAGIIPGMLLTVALMVTAYVVARRRGYPAEPFPGFSRLLVFFFAALPGLLLIAIIFGGVRSGVFTATESSCIAVIYAFHVTGSARHRHGRCLCLAHVLSAGAGHAHPGGQVDLGQPDGRPAADHRGPPAAWHFHGHGAVDHHHDARFPADRPGLRHRSRAFRCHHDPERRDRADHAAGWNRPLRRLCRGQDHDPRSDADHLAILWRLRDGAFVGYLHSRDIALAAGAVQMILPPSPSEGFLQGPRPLPFGFRRHSAHPAVTFWQVNHAK